jgi:hypothetical protein
MILYSFSFTKLFDFLFLFLYFHIYLFHLIFLSLEYFINKILMIYFILFLSATISISLVSLMVIINHRYFHYISSNNLILIHNSNIMLVMLINFLNIAVLNHIRWNYLSLCRFCLNLFVHMQIYNY